MKPSICCSDFGHSQLSWLQYYIGGEFAGRRGCNVIRSYLVCSSTRFAAKFHEFTMQRSLAVVLSLRRQWSSLFGKRFSAACDPLISKEFVGTLQANLGKLHAELSNYALVVLITLYYGRSTCAFGWPFQRRCHEPKS